LRFARVSRPRQTFDTHTTATEHARTGRKPSHARLPPVVHDIHTSEAEGRVGSIRTPRRPPARARRHPQALAHGTGPRAFRGGSFATSEHARAPLGASRVAAPPSHQLRLRRLSIPCITLTPHTTTPSSRRPSPSKASPSPKVAPHPQRAHRRRRHTRTRSTLPSHGPALGLRLASCTPLVVVRRRSAPAAASLGRPSSLPTARHRAPSLA